MKRIASVALLASFLLLLSGCGLLRAVLNRSGGRPAVATGVLVMTPAPEETESPEEPLPTEAPVATEAPTEAPAPLCSKVTVTYGTGKVTVVGLDASGGTLWSRAFTIAEETELNPYSEATLDGNTVYVQVNYHMLALDAATGETIWTSAATGGLCKPVVDDGTVYTCSYYGAALIGINAADGATLFEAARFDDTFYWAYKLELTDGGITVYFDAAGPDQGKGSAVFDFSGNLVSKKVD